MKAGCFSNVPTIELTAMERISCPTQGLDRTFPSNIRFRQKQLMACAVQYCASSALLDSRSIKVVKPHQNDAIII